MGQESLRNQESLDDKLIRTRILLKAKADEAMSVVSAIASEEGLSITSATRMGLVLPELAVEALQLLDILDQSSGITFDTNEG